jgi:hypothetical protein
MNVLVISNFSERYSAALTKKNSVTGVNFVFAKNPQEAESVCILKNNITNE